MEFEHNSNETNNSPEDKEKKKKRKRRPARVPLSVDQESPKQDEPEKKGKTKPDKKKPKPEQTEVTKEKSEEKHKKSPEVTPETVSDKKDRPEESEAEYEQIDGHSEENSVHENEAPHDEHDLETELDARREHSAEETPLPSKKEAVLPLREKEEHEEELFVSDRLLKSQQKEEATPEKEALTMPLETDSQPKAQQEAKIAEPVETDSPAHAVRSRARRRSKRSAATTSPATSSNPGSTPKSNAPLASAAAVPAPATANMAPRQTRNQELYYVERNGVRRGVISGLLLGGMIEHFRHRRREKKLKANLEKAEKTVKRVEENQTFMQQEQQRNERESERRKTALERQIERLKSTAVEKNEPVSKLEVRSGSRRPYAVETAQNLPLQEVKREPSVSAAPEARTSQQRTERKVKQEEAKLTPDIKKAQQAVEEAIEEQLKVPEGHHIETSAWHSIEVDNKTGRAAENPLITYGEEFRHEQHQELLRQQAADAEEQKKKQASPSNYELFQQATTPKLPEHASSGNNTKYAKSSPIAQKARDLQSAANNTNPVDIALWVTLFVVIIAIIIAL